MRCYPYRVLEGLEGLEVGRNVELQWKMQEGSPFGWWSPGGNETASMHFFLFFPLFLEETFGSGRGGETRRGGPSEASESPPGLLRRSLCLRRRLRRLLRSPAGS